MTCTFFRPAILAASLALHATLLGGSFSVAAAATSQSPIDIRSQDTDFAILPELQFTYGSAVDLVLLNTGSATEESVVRVNLPAGDGSMLTIDGVGYELLQFHFHREAEHLVNGVRAPLELHQVHRAADGTLAVVGQFIEEGPDANPLFEELLDAFPLPNAPSGTLDDFDLAGLLVPADRGSYRYSGSLTTPPFSEPVLWNLIAAPLVLSADQIEAFELLFFGENIRDTQPLNGRPVVTDVPGFAAVPLPGAAGLLLAGILALAALRARPMRPV